MPVAPATRTTSSANTSGGGRGEAALPAPPRHAAHGVGERTAQRQGDLGLHLLVRILGLHGQRADHVAIVGGLRRRSFELRLQLRDALLEFLLRFLRHLVEAGARAGAGWSVVLSVSLKEKTSGANDRARVEAWAGQLA